MTDDTQNKAQLVFPCFFPIKVMGKKHADFEAEIISIVNKHAPNLSEGAIKINESKNGTYISMTITIDAQSKEQLDNIYFDLTACKKVIMAL